MKQALTETKEDYIRAIFYLQNKLGRTAKSVEIAKHLSLSRSTVAERLLTLAKDGYIERNKYGSAVLTKKGADIAQKLTFKHRLIEVFLHTMLRRPVDAIHDEAHKLEHAFTDQSIEALYELLGKPDSDPHGQPINQ